MSCEDGDEEENIFRTPLSIHKTTAGVAVRAFARQARDIFLYLGDISIFLRTNPHTT